MKRLISMLVFACAVVCTAVAQAAPIPLTQGQPMTLSATADGTAPFTYQWSKGATVLPQTTASLAFTSITAADAATYSVKISNPWGSANASVTIIIGQPPTNPKISVVQQIIAWLKKVFGRATG